jgi:hypothetical protein
MGLHPHLEKEGGAMQEDRTRVLALAVRLALTYDDDALFQAALALSAAAVEPALQPARAQDWPAIGQTSGARRGLD